MAEYKACGCCETPVRQGCACMCDLADHLLNVLTDENDPLADENQPFAQLPPLDHMWLIWCARVL